jgi:hypothetical protein
MVVRIYQTEGTKGHLSIMESARYRIQIRGVVNTCSVINPETKYNYCTSELFAFTFRITIQDAFVLE